MICKICGKEFKSNSGFGYHISKTHDISAKQYYDTYIKTNLDGVCTVCGKETKFINVIQGYHKHCSLKCAHNDSIVKDKRKQTNLIKYGTEQVLSSPIIKEKARKTCKDLYGNEEIFKTLHFRDEYKETNKKHFGVDHHMKESDISSTKKRKRKIRHYYKYDSLIFDSSWELATYIWHKDHNIDIIRNPCTFEYIGLDHIKHIYSPDFEINGQIIEIKGNHYLKEDGKLKDEAKQQCIDDNGVTIWSYNEVKTYIQYCEKLFKNIYWYKTFVYKVEYKPSKCKHTALEITPVKCCICNKTFKNGKYLSAHLKFEEHVTGKDYYDTYIKKPNEGICIVCGKPTTYINFTRGYTKTCSQACNNNPLSTKGKNVSKTKQAYSEDRKLEIKQKRINTCLKKYGVACNLQIPEIRQKSNESK